MLWAKLQFSSRTFKMVWYMSKLEGEAWVIYFLCGEGKALTVTLLERPDHLSFKYLGGGVTNSFIVQLLIVPQTFSRKWKT